MEKAENGQFTQNIEDVLRYRLESKGEPDLEVYIDNRRTTLEEALARCVQERSVYMPDYILDENGVLEQIRFDKIKEQYAWSVPCDRRRLPKKRMPLMLNDYFVTDSVNLS